jgi:hypothetical protein
VCVCVYMYTHKHIIGSAVLWHLQVKKNCERPIIYTVIKSRDAYCLHHHDAANVTCTASCLPAIFVVLF